MLRKARVPYGPKICVWMSAAPTALGISTATYPSPSGTGLTFGQPGLRPCHFGRTWIRCFRSTGMVERKEYLALNAEC